MIHAVSGHRFFQNSTGILPYNAGPGADKSGHETCGLLSLSDFDETGIVSITHVVPSPMQVSLELGKY